MAELITKAAGAASKSKHPGVRKCRKIATRVDLTPMVDLGFLLITFFMLSTSLSHPTSMHLTMPDDNTPAHQAIKSSGALTIWLGAHSRLYIYEGKLASGLGNIQRTSFEHIRQIIVQKKNALRDPGDMFVTIIPGEDCTYKNIIDVLDELSIDQISSYALVNKVDPVYTGFIHSLDQVVD